MKISKLELDHFGKFSHATFNFESGMNIIYGSNEAGKTTLQEAVQAIFFGFGRTPKLYGLKSWHQDVLRIKATLQGDDGDLFDVERLLSKTAEGRILRGVLSESLGNDMLPELHHLNKQLYKQVYGLNTSNTTEFQQLDWTGMIRNMLQTSGTETLVPTDKVLMDLEEMGNRYIRLNGRGHYELKNLEAQGRELEEKRRELLRQRDDVSDLVIKEKLVAKKLKILSDDKKQLNRDLSDREIFLTPWMMMGSGTVVSSNSICLAKKYSHPRQALALMQLILEQNQKVVLKDQEISGFKQGVIETWRSLFGTNFEFCFENANELSANRGEQGVMLAREGRLLKSKIKDLPKVRGSVGVLLSIIGGAGAFVLQSMRLDSWMPLMMGVFAVGLWFSVEGFLLYKTNGLKLNKLMVELDHLFYGKLPKNALDTLDESYFERLNRLSKDCERLNANTVERAALMEQVLKTLATLDQNASHQIQHSVEGLSEQMQTLYNALQQLEQQEQAEERLQQALSKAEAETGMTMEALLDKLSSEGAGSLPQSIEQLRSQREALSLREQELSSQQAVLLKEIELSSNLEALPQVEAAIALNKEDVVALKLKRDRLSVLETFIRKMESDYNKTHQPELIRNAAERFKQISGDRYHRLYLEERPDLKSEVAIESGLQVEGEEGVYKLSQLTSTGTREQLFMALKLAIANQMEVGREQLPLMLDEVFSHWDGERTSKCLEMLKVESEKRQIMLFTCHRHLADFAVESTGGHLIELI